MSGPERKVGLDSVRKAVIEIVRARPGNAATLTDIALAAKRHWGYPERWIESWRRELTILPESIAGQEIYMAMATGQTVGFHALRSDEERLRLEHFWVVPRAMNNGIGRCCIGFPIAGN